MARFDIVIDTTGLQRKLTRLEKKQLPFANSLAANQAAFATMNTMRAAAPLFFDKPTPFTIRGIQYRKGNKDAPVAEVFVSEDRNKGTPVTRVLGHHVRGGTRAARRSERVLQRAGILRQDEIWVPGEGVAVNAYGNLPGSLIVQILSQLRAFGEQGFTANITQRSRSRGANRRRAQYFLSSGENGLPRGVYKRTGPGLRRVLPVLLFVRSPSYSKRFDFYRIAERELRRRFVDAWPAAMRRALATAR